MDKHNVTVPFTLDQLATIRGAAERMGLTLSAYIRQATLLHADSLNPKVS
jgi:hypothetical protein